MSRSKATISGGRSYQGVGEYWDEHDLSDFWKLTKPVDIEVAIKGQRHYYPLEESLSQRVTRMARARGVSPETLVNLWIREKVESE